MIKILKPGTCYCKNCYHCGCKFIYSQKECFQESFFDEVYSIYCPHCGESLPVFFETEQEYIDV